MKNLSPATWLFTLLLAAPAVYAQAGYWHTSGNQILDSNNQPVRIAGVNWYGFETTDEVAHGLWAQDYKSVLNTIHSNGYNVVRLPFSNQMVETPIVPNVSYNNGSGPINSDLQGLNSVQILDKIVAYAGQIGLHIILDNHRSEAGNSAEANGLWYTSSYPETAWINDWVALANRYKSSAIVIGMDLRNEPHNATSGGSCWGCGSTTNDWRLAAQRGGNAVLAANPNLLIFVEGTDCFNGDCDWWGGNLQGASSYPVALNVANRLVYSAHDYGPHEYGQSWFNGSTTYASLSAVWTKNWAYLSLNGIAPVWLGEFGTTNNAADIANSSPGSQGQWFQSLISFLSTNTRISWTYWALNGEDSYGLLDSQYNSTPGSAAKQQALASIQSSGSGGGGTTPPACQTAPPIPQSVNASAVSSSQINISWTGVTAPSGCSVTYNVYAAKTSGFTPSSANLLAGGLTSATYSAAGLASATTYYFAVTALDSIGTSAASAQASASTPSAAVSAPVAPYNLTATATSSSNIALSWQASSTSNVTYNVYRSQTSGFTLAQGARLATGVTGTNYANSGLRASTTYYYLVTATASGSESSASNQAAATTPAVVTTAAACHIGYSVNSQWPGGFNVSITIQNTGSTSLSNWTLTWNWSANQSISQAWNANLVQPGPPSVVLTNASWNPTIAPGSTISGVGFNGSFTGSNPTPTAFYLNGVMCR